MSAHRDASAETLIARSSEPPSSGPRLVGKHSNGYKFGPSRFAKSARIAETQRAIAVPGVSFSDHGYEVLDAKGAFVSWHDCPVNAMAVLRPDTFRDGKVVRCCDRVLLKTKRPGRGRL